MNTQREVSCAVQVLVVGAAFVVVVAGMKAAAGLLVPMLLALFITIIIAPLSFSLSRAGLPNWLAMSVIFLLLVLIIIFGFGFIGDTVDQLNQRLPEYQARLKERYRDLPLMLTSHGVPLPDSLASGQIDFKAGFGFVSRLLGGLVSVMSDTFLLLLLVFFMLIEGQALPAKMKAIARLNTASLDRVNRLVVVVRDYMTLKFYTSVLTGLLVWLLLSLLGGDFAALLGFAAFLLNFIPTIGSVIAAIPGVLLAFIQFDLTLMLLTLLGYLAINVLIGNILEPRIMGRKLGMSPLMIMLAMLFWGWVLGPVGMLLSVPLTNVIKIVLENDVEPHWFNILLDDRPQRASK